MIMRCPVCRKKFDVLYTNLWRYKRDKRFLCSWGCLRKYDRKEDHDMALTEEQKKKAVEIAEGGKTPLPWLKECGVKNPSSSWRSIRETAVRKDPEMEGKLPQSFGQQKKEKTEKVRVVTIPWEDVEDFKTVAVRNSCGKFYIDEGLGTVTWIPAEIKTGMAIALDPEGWTRLAETIPKMLKKLGMEV